MGSKRKIPQHLRSKPAERATDTSGRRRAGAALRQSETQRRTLTSAHPPLTIGDLQPGHHLCCLYETEEEHRAVLTPFMREGLEAGEKLLYIVDARQGDTILGYLRDSGIDVESCMARGQLTIRTADDVYMRQGVFDPDGMIALLRAETEGALAEGYAALRVTGEMTWALRGLAGSQRLMEYEARLNEFLPGSACLGICQYDRRAFSPSLLLDVVRSHPFVAIGTSVYDNFYYMPPDEFLGQEPMAAQLRHCVENLAERSRVEDALREAHARLESRVVQRTAQLSQTNRSLRTEITERKRAEDALRASEEHLRDVVANAPIVLFAIDREGMFTLAEGKGLSAVGIEPGEHIGRSVFDVYLDVPEIIAVARRALAGEAFTATVEVVDLVFEAHVAPVRDGDGTIAGAIAVATNITERKRAEEARRESERRFRDVLEVSRDMVYKVNLETGSFDYVSPSVLQLSGFTPEEFVGLGLEEIANRFHPDARERVMAVINDLPHPTVQAGAMPRVEYPWKTKAGKYRWFSDSRALVCDEEGRAVAIVGTVRDITERKRTEEELERHRLHLAELVEQRTAEVTALNNELEAFVHAVSHDLRAPLRAIDGFTRVLLEDFADELDARAIDSLLRVRRASQRMRQLIDDLLVLSRVTRSEMHRERVDLSALAKTAAAGLQEGEPERRVRFEIQEGLIVRGDASLLGVVLENLLDNAWKFTRRNASAHIDFGSTQSGGEVTYFVRDNGVGFDMAGLDRVFSPFQRLHPEGEFPGTGVGLATVQRVIHRHGGRVWAESSVGQGATFYFTFNKETQAGSPTPAVW